MSEPTAAAHGLSDARLRNVKDQFEAEGYALLPDFYDQARLVAPIREGARAIVGLVAEKHGIDAPTDDVESALSAGMAALIAHDRALGGVVYDAIKQIPEFMQLTASPANKALFEALRPGSMAGLAAGGYGIRIDHPAEEKFRTFWHQEFHGQLRSLDGVVFWSPLLAMTPEMGPVQIAAGSHKSGPIPVYDDEQGGRSGAYALRLEREAERLAAFEIVEPLTAPGDLLVMDFLTLHQSGINRSSQARWSMQLRYFNFLEPTGRKIDWAGSYAAGVDFATLFPELRASDAAQEASGEAA